jgi:hypothetical protein
MGANAQVKMSSRTQYSRYLGDFRGVDFSSSPAMVAQNRFSYLKNMWKDYESKQGQAIETMPGYRIVLSALAGKGKIYSIHEYRDCVMVKCGKALYCCKFGTNGMTIEPSGSPVARDLNDGPITGFVFNNDFWFLDGKDYCHYTYGKTSLEYATGIAYVPTTYIDGEEYEQRNILTNRFKEKAFVGGKAIKETKASTGSKGLTYTIFDERQVVMITGCTQKHDTLIIPDQITVDGKEYPVDSIQSAYGSQNNVYEGSFVGYPCRILSLPEGITVGNGAFSDCYNLDTIVVRKSSLKTPGRGFFATKAFRNCTKLQNIYFYSTKITPESGSEYWSMSFNSDCFPPVADYTSDIQIYFNQSLGELVKIPEWSSLPLKTAEEADYFTNFTDNTVYSGLAGSYFDVTLFEPCKTIETQYDSATNTHNTFIRYNGQYIASIGWTYETIKEDGYIQTVRVFTQQPIEAGDEIEIMGRGEFSKLSTSKRKDVSIFDANASYDASDGSKALDILLKCTVTAIFDGRIFFTGNPDLPNTVLYSARDLTSANNPAYIGVYNYFNDGVGDKRNAAMISTPSMLIVCKENTKQDGSCWYHVGQDTGYDLIPRVYPSTQGVAGIGCVGAATNFSDDPVFLSTEGLMAIGKQTVNLERTVEHRSSNVDLKLKRCDLSAARMAEWKGYLVLLVDGQIFLADSRQLFQHDTGVTQYEWYYADDIGIYVGQTQMVSTTTGSILATVNGESVDLSAPEYADRLTWSQNGGGTGTVRINRDRESVRYDSAQLLASNAAILLDGTDTGLKFPIVSTDDGAYLATYVDQYSGGSFSPAISLCVLGDRLLLGTEHGEILCMNTDLRGKNVWRAIRRPEGFTAPDGDTRVYADPTEDMIWTDKESAPTVETDFGTYAVITTGSVSYLAEKIEVDPDEIWQGFYSRNGREIPSVCETLCDPSAYPQIAKNTVRKSIVVRSKSMGISEYRVFIRSNREQEWRECRRTSRTGNMVDLEFGNLSYLTNDIVISVVPDRLKRWQWQQFRFESSGYCKPFGLLDLFYRYENGGNIK